MILLYSHGVCCVWYSWCLLGHEGGVLRGGRLFSRTLRSLWYMFVCSSFCLLFFSVCERYIVLECTTDDSNMPASKASWSQVVDVKIFLKTFLVFWTSLILPWNILNVREYLNSPWLYTVPWNVFPTRYSSLFHWSKPSNSCAPRSGAFNTGEKRCCLFNRQNLLLRYFFFLSSLRFSQHFIPAIIYAFDTYTLARLFDAPECEVTG